AEVQNYRGILEYTDEVIAIEGKKQVLMIRGSSLLIEYFTNESMKVTGQIDMIEYNTKKMRWKR
ncbi:MAG: YabP/YqfC family sporulation protein, partial [Lachnospiraceae bacterium]